MEVSYTSYWRAIGNNTFALRGVIGANQFEIRAFFPRNDKDVYQEEAREEWLELIRDWRNDANRCPPLTCLKHIVRSGNGVTEEYDRVRSVTAESFEQALEQAYSETVARSGRTTQLYGEVERDQLVDRGDPLIRSSP